MTCKECKALPPACAQDSLGYYESQPNESWAQAGGSVLHSLQDIELMT